MCNKCELERFVKKLFLMYPTIFFPCNFLSVRYLFVNIKVIQSLKKLKHGHNNFDQYVLTIV